MHPFLLSTTGPSHAVFPMEDHDVKTYFEALELSIDDVFWHSLTWASRVRCVKLESYEKGDR